MAKKVSLDIEVNARLNDASLKQQQKAVETAFSDVPVELDLVALEQDIEQIERLVQQALDEVDALVLDADVDTAIAEIQKVADELAGLEGADIPVGVNTDEVVKSIKEIAEEYNKIKTDAQAAYAEQFAVVAKLANEGRQSTEEYEQAVAVLKDRRAALDRIADIEASITDELREQEDIDPYEQIKSSAEDAFASQLAATRRLAAEQKEGTEEYEQAVILLKQRKAELDNVLNIEKRITDELEEQEKVDPLDALVQMEAFNQIGEAVDKAVEKGENFQAEMKRLGATTDATGEELEELQDRAKDAFLDGVGESASEAIKIVGEAQSIVGKFFQGDELQGFTKVIGAGADQFGKEFAEIASKGQGLIKAFDLDGQESAGLITLAMRDARVAADDALDTIQEYPLHFKKAGFAAEEMIGLMTRGADAGSFTTDKIADAVKETTIKLNDGTLEAGINSLTNVPAALQEKLFALTNQAKQGAITVKDLITGVTSATEEAVSQGQIGEQLRAQIQAAISGSPAEELGTDLYAKLFGAPIDVNEVRRKAEQAAQAVTDASSPATFADKVSRQLEFLQEKAAATFLPLTKNMQAVVGIAPQLVAVKQFLPEGALDAITGKFGEITKMAGGPLKSAMSALPGMITPWTIGIAAAAGALTLFFTKTEKGKEIWERLSSGVEALYKKAKPVIDSLGGIAESLGGILIEFVLQPFELAGAAISGIIQGVVALAQEIAEFLGLADAGDLTADFEALANVFDMLKVRLDGVLAGFQAMKEGVGEVVEKLFSGDITGAISAAGSLGDKVGKAMKEGTEKSLQEIKMDKLQEKIEGGFQIKEDLDKNGKLKELIEKYKGAKDEVAKQNLAEQIAKQAKGAVESVTPIVDETTGEVREVYNLSLGAAEDFADAQEQALTTGLQDSQGAFVDVLKEQAAQYDANKEKLMALGREMIQSGKSKEEIAKLNDEYKKQEEALQASHDALAATIVQGEALGVTGENFAEVAAKSGETAENAAQLAARVKTFAKETDAAKKAARDLAAEWNQSKAAIDNAVNSSVARLAQIQQDRKKGIIDAEEAKRLEAEIIEQGRKAVRDQKAAAVEEERAQKRLGLIATSLLDTLRAQYDKRSASLDLEQRLYEIAVEKNHLDNERERSSGDDLAVQEKAVEITQKRIDAMKELFKITTGKNGEIKVGVKVGKEASAELVQEFQGLLADLNEGQNAVADIKLQAKIETAEFEKDVRAFERETLQLHVELGLAGTADLEAAFDKEINVLGSQIEALQAKLSVPGVLKPEDERAIRQQLITLQREYRDFEAQKRDTVRAGYDKQLSDLQELHARELEAEQTILDKRAEMVERYIATASEARAAVLEIEKAQLLKQIDDEAAARSNALDARTEADLAALDALKEEEFINERQYQIRRRELEKNAEAERARSEEEARKKREEAEEDARRKSLRAQANADGQRLFAQAQHDKKLLSVQKDRMEKEAKIAREKADKSGLDEDKRAAEQIERALEGIEKTLTEKGDSVRVLADSIGGTLSDSITQAFEGNGDALADGFRKTFATIAGAIKAELAAFALQIVLESAPIKALAAAAGPFAPVVLAGITATITAGISALAAPILNTLTSFATGGRIDQPTIALIGDAARLGGQNREWIFRDDQLRAVIAMSSQGNQRAVVGAIQRLERTIEQLPVIGEIAGDTIRASNRRSTRTRNRRLW